MLSLRPDAMLPGACMCLLPVTCDVAPLVVAEAVAGCGLGALHRGGWHVVLTQGVPVNACGHGALGRWRAGVVGMPRYDQMMEGG